MFGIAVWARKNMNRRSTDNNSRKKKIKNAKIHQRTAKSCGDDQEGSRRAEKMLYEQSNEILEQFESRLPLTFFG